MLYLCATPIGNLGDITLRAIEALKSCDAVYCEDTRHTLQLLNHLDIKKPLVSCHQHNERARAQEVAALLREGKTIVYASDAGMPGISDPGALLVEACVREELPFTVLPGASAVLTAVVMSGLPPAPFTFFGFLPREGKPRKEMLAAIGRCGHLAILYESPQRVQKTLSALLETIGDAPAAVLRELTKKFEQVRRGPLSQLIPLYQEPPKGECVIAVFPAAPQSGSGQNLEETLLALLQGGGSVRDAAEEAALLCGVPKKTAYREALRLRENGNIPLQTGENPV